MTTYRNDFLRDFSEAAVCASLLDAIAARARRWQLARVFDYQQCIEDLLRAAGVDHGPAVDAAMRLANEQGIDGSPSQGMWEAHPDAFKLVAAVWGLQARGVLYPIFINRSGTRIAIDQLAITPRGCDVIANPEHPLRPLTLKRFREKCPSAPHDVHAAIEDAVACLEHNLPRPAVAMAGLAFEITLERTFDELVTQGAIQNAPAKQSARDRLAFVLQGIPKWQGTVDERHRLTFACTAAEELRRRRNEAAHPGQTPIRDDEADELVLSAMRHVPVYWQTVLA